MIWGDQANHDLYVKRIGNTDTGKKSFFSDFLLMRNKSKNKGGNKFWNQ